jgi:hypothetical protein
LFKYLTFEDREASITSSPEPKYHGPTNVTSDQAGDIAVYNADLQKLGKDFCDRIERAVKRLSKMERFWLKIDL